MAWQCTRTTKRDCNAHVQGGTPIQPSSLQLVAEDAWPDDDAFAREGVPIPEITDTERQLREETERVLEQCKGNQAAAARVVGIPRTTLINRLKRFRRNSQLQCQPVEIWPDQ